jgi:hypothetical protein
MSFGESEVYLTPADVATLDATFTAPSAPHGVSFFASSGDNGGVFGPEYPSVSPYVVAVGGTGLDLNSDSTYKSENGWTGSGGGYSVLESEPGYQFAAQQSGTRSTPDVSYTADSRPQGPGHLPGVAVLDSFGLGGWAEIAGTSVGSPQWAAYIAIVNQGRAQRGLLPLDGVSDLLPALYNNIYATSPYSLEPPPPSKTRTNVYAQDFHDITLGTNVNYSALPGYDLVTGLGSPIGNALSNTLINLASSPGGGGGGIGSGGGGGGVFSIKNFKAAFSAAILEAGMARITNEQPPAGQTAARVNLPGSVILSTPAVVGPALVRPASAQSLATATADANPLNYLPNSNSAAAIGGAQDEAAPESVPGPAPLAGGSLDETPLIEPSSSGSVPSSSTNAPIDLPAGLQRVLPYLLPTAVDVYFAEPGSAEAVPAIPSVDGARVGALDSGVTENLGLAAVLLGGGWCLGLPSWSQASDPEMTRTTPRRRAH